MDLETLHRQVKKAVLSLDFKSIWPGFDPLRFALYDDEKCFFDGRYIEKTDAFCANTSIVYRDEQIAIWMVQEELDISVLTSKIVHEMFHGYQSIMGWDCGPKELEALFRYEYTAGNLSLKMRENELLLALLDHFEDSDLNELLAHRKLRSERFPYQFSYESRVEEIEGTANYVEWQVLKQLDENRATALTDHMRKSITKAEYLFPIRIACYYTGALMINALHRAGLYSFASAERPLALSVLKGVVPSDGRFFGEEACIESVSGAVAAFNEKTESIIRSALKKNEVVLNGPLELAGVNIYNARFLNGFITSTFFLMYREGKEDKLLRGNFVIKMMDEKTIDCVYRWA